MASRLGFMSNWPGFIVFLWWLAIIVVVIFVISLIVSPLGGLGLNWHVGHLFFDVGIRKS